MPESRAALVSTAARAAAIVVLVLVLVPFVVLSFHAHASTDDFCSVIIVRDRGFWEAAGYWYAEWTGRYVSIVMMNLTPRAMESRLAYAAVPVAIIVGFLLAVWWLIAGVARTLRATGFRSIPWALAATGIYFAGMPSPAEGLYWFTGSTFYTVGAVAAIACVAAAVYAQTGSTPTGRIAWVGVSALLAFAAAGSNEVVLLMLGWTLLVLAVVAFRARHPRWKLWLVPLGAVSIGFIFDILAPGNMKRAAATGGIGDPFGPLVGSGVMSVWSATDWISPAPVVVALFALVAAGSLASATLDEASAWKRTPWLVPLLAGVVAVWGGLFFTHWTSGFALRPGAPHRVANVVAVFFLASVALTALLLGIQVVGARGVTRLASVSRAQSAILLGIGVLLLGRGNARVGYEDIVTRRAAVYDTELRHRYATLEAASATDTVTVPPLSREPRTLLFRDITSDASDWRNRCYALYFRVAAVKIAE
jgi:hypothetical protein